MNIGLLGGSFNPAHEGHVYISRLAIKKLNLDQLWWLITTQNPLKKENQKVSLAKRIQSTCIISKDYKIRTLTLDLKFKSNFTFDTLKKLKKTMPEVRFFWIIGADNLYQMHFWHRWRELFYLCPIIVFDRPGFFYKAINSKASKYFWKYKTDVKNLKNRNLKKLPMWSFISIKKHNASSTEKRNMSR